MLVDIFLLILSTGVPATRLNAQFNYVSILSCVICSMYVSILSYLMCSMYVSMLCHVFHVCEYTKLCHVFHVCEYAVSCVPCCVCVGELLLHEKWTIVCFSLFKLLVL